MARLVIVSNRVAGPRERTVRAGGVAVALREALRRQGGIWFGWSGDVVEAAASTPHLHESGAVTTATLDLDARDHDDFYLGYANATLWPLFHYRLGLMDFRREAFAGYLRVNERFAAALVPLLRPDDVVWIHDYHFIPLAAALRARGVANRIGFFLHIPFPAPEVLATLPDHEVLIEALRAYDLIGLQTTGDAEALAAAMAGTQAAVGPAWTTSPTIASFPIGIDVDGFAELAEQAVQSRESRQLAASLAGRALVIGVDRLDYSKGLPLRFDAFEALLAGHPGHRRRVTYLQIAPISRGGVPEYRKLRRELDQRAGRINGRYSDVDWTPIRYLNRVSSRAALAGYYRLSRVGFVTPIRDGMNLVAKEFIAAQDPADPGVLVLSRFAGAAAELEDALIVNPMDVERVAAALDRALTMPLAERQERWRRLVAAMRRNDEAAWRNGFLAALDAAPRAPGGVQSSSAA
ncbi:MAG: trehalose-6-phosphate synthase [Alphaproteobacteria bacterium]|nr:trehalose-6-phosphate synthase [Alphaproteobacteria bacterium]